ncbi:MAG TPA: hypothetical protein VGR35_08075 [Tepidisphaeraceae bacterium]|nr:hypothetical protein [Tepidisphaeraceae bacterium]
MLILTLPAVAAAGPPEGYPWTLHCEFYQGSFTPTTRPSAERVTMRWWDAYAAWIGFAPDGKELRLFADPDLGLPYVWFDVPALSATVDTVTSPDWIVGQVFRFSGSPAFSCAVLDADYGYMTDFDRILKMFTFGMGLGVVVDLLLCMFGFAIAGARREAENLIRAAS